MNEEKNEEKLDEIVDDLKLEEIESPEELIEAINKLSQDHEVHINVKKFQRASGIKWWIFLLIETLLSIASGLGLIGILKPFIFENAYSPYIYLVGICSLVAIVKIILRYLKVPFLFLFIGIIHYVLSILVIVVFTLLIPDVYIANTFTFGIFIALLIFADSVIRKFIRRF